MMNYIKITFNTIDEDQRANLIALFSEDKFTGFEECEDETLVGYIAESDFDESYIKTAIQPFGLNYYTHFEVEKNWNETWEKDFEPVVIPGFCAIRAHFHKPIAGVQHEILITPKMSFGTGHHATTKMMMTLMKDVDFTNHQVFDFGTGTGILAILAEKLGATQVLGVDIDEWSFENAIENCENNHTNHIKIKLGGIEWAQNHQFDIILANINRHILLNYMEDMAQTLASGKLLILSGILFEQDEKIIKDAAANAQFTFMKESVENGWAAMIFAKQ